MGRKRREGSGELAMLLLLLFLSVTLQNARGEREVGCLFNKNLCNPETEVCYVDWAFGRCILIEDHLAKKDLYQYNLEPQELQLLRMQLERLEYEGYKWPHDYTQCVMQIMLDDLRYRTNNDVEELCKGLKVQDETTLNDETQVIDTPGIKTVGDEEPAAIVRFSPSKINPHGEFADEFYYPALAGGTQKYEENHLDDYDESFYDKLGAIGDRQEALYRRGSRSLSSTGDSAELPDYPKDKYAFPQEYVQEALRGFLEKEAKVYAGEEGVDELDFLPSAPTSSRIPWFGDKRPAYETGFARKYKFPKELDGLDLLDSRAAAIPRGDAYAEETPSSISPVRQRPPPHDPFKNLPLDEDLKNMLLRREMAGFKRRERLDVKKPGPPFSTNNYAFKTQSPPINNNGNVDETSDKKPVENTVDNGVMQLPQTKKEIDNSKSSSIPNTYENVDLDHVYIQFDKEFHSWSEGERVVNLVGSLLRLQPGELKEIRVGRAEVTFKVSENSRQYNAMDVVNRIANIRKDLKKELNVEVVRAGIGDKTKLPAVLEVQKTGSVDSAEMSSSLFGALVAAGVAGVSTAAVVILVIARRHAKSRAKLAGLRTPDPEASKDYQDLCRARMQAKQADKLTESPKGFDFGRLIETGKSEHESNRSSTSSWCDPEPQLTNMDAATGHLLLSYMEEHLKNREKLDEEWAALCAYEAEPCSTAVAEAEGNSECNRSGAALPYDHSRVILNDLANLNNSDYINASTITDHDPRNPAYIATQGPLPQTAADFWQLVWEQGSVVIVMLTRLAEEGETMCHRYWPEEGSELYHIYEVHIVSEHVWCDDYLVRSFYLKNLRTGETRTLTQFHFLTWARDSVPSSTKTLLEFRRKVNKSYRGRSCPIIIHCSDGAARTGTYCLIDMVLNRMAKGAKEIDIAATLEHIRDQRSGMVATKEQFEFVLMAVAEEVTTILKSLPVVDEGAAKSTETSSPNKSDK